jgi:uncharacterized membrane protein YphA (DoxX/SURF4 family)
MVADALSSHCVATMQRLYSMFPRGGPGAGLLLLRVSAVASLHILSPADMHWVPWLLALVLGFGLVAGLMTPLVCLAGMALVLALGYLSARVPLPAAVVLVLQLLALLLLGPGGYSVDARLFGRRIVDVGRST